MGRHGAKPVPSTVLRFRQTIRSTPQNTIPTSHLSCPAWLDSESRKLFRTLATELYHYHLSTVVDRLMLARYCRMYTRWQEMEEYIRTHEQVREVYGKKGDDIVLIGMKPIPQVSIAKQLASELIKLEKEFGFSPMSRASMRIQPQPQHEEVPTKERFFRT